MAVGNPAVGNSSSAQERPCSARKRGYYIRRNLWVYIQRLEALLSLLRARRNELPKEGPDLEELQSRLAQARECAEKGSEHPYRRVDNILFWDLVHGIEADLLLLMPMDLLAAKALVVEEQFQRKIEEPVAREVWLGQDNKSGPLRRAVELIKALALQEPLSPRQQQELRLARYVLWDALHLLNGHTEKYFRQLYLNMVLRCVSGCLLLVSFCLSFLIGLPQALYETLTSPTEPAVVWPWKGILSIALLGVAGAVVANLLSSDPLLSLRGTGTWRLFAYYLVIKPAMGAFAALLLFVLAQSQLLFSLESSGSEPPRALAPDVQQLQPPQPRPPLRIQLGSETALACTYIVFFIAIGFSAEKFLGSAMDKVMDNLFVLAEKSEPSSNTPPTSSASEASRPGRRAQGSDASSGRGV
jgi:hypothetical protein